MSLSPLPARQCDASRDVLAARFAQVRAHSLALAAPLSAEDQCVQSMPDASPTTAGLPTDGAAGPAPRNFSAPALADGTLRLARDAA